MKFIARFFGDIVRLSIVDEPLGITSGVDLGKVSEDEHSRDEVREDRCAWLSAARSVRSRH
jgi:hypothetical protein